MTFGNQKSLETKNNAQDKFPRGGSFEFKGTIWALRCSLRIAAMDKYRR
jgi:hypothetical protein